MNPAAHVSYLRVESQCVADLLAHGDPARPVPACPNWTLSSLVDHLGHIYLWARGHVIGEPMSADPNDPGDPRALLEWFTAAAGALIATFDATDADQPCWTLAPPETARFWMRRQALETLIHRWDAECSQGQPRGLDPDLCLDGIDEVLTVMLPRQQRLGRLGTVPAVTVESSGRTWTVGAAEDPVLLSGPPDAILLLLWGRQALESGAATVVGEPRRVAELLRSPIVP